MNNTPSKQLSGNGQANTLYNYKGGVKVSGKKQIDSF